MQQEIDDPFRESLSLFLLGLFVLIPADLLFGSCSGVCLGITCVVDRTKPEAPSPIPIVASALKLDLPNYAPEECPICKEGKLPLVHLGSRKMKQEAKQTL